MFPKPTAKAVGFFVYVLEFVVVARSSYFVLVLRARARARNRPRARRSQPHANHDLYRCVRSPQNAML